MAGRLKPLLLSLTFIAALTGGILSVIPTAHADINDFTVKDFSADYYLNNKDRQGEMRIVERITVDFTDQNHGLLRALPETYNKHSLHLHINSVSSETAAPTQFDTYESNGNKVLKIGDANRTVTGPQEYTVDYTVDNVIAFYGDIAQLYWNVNGVQWQQPFDHVAVTVHLPDNLIVDSAEDIQPQCFSGAAGDKDSSCTITSSSTDHTIKAETTAPLPAYANLSFATGFKSGYFHANGFADYVADYWKPVASFLILPLLVGGFGLQQWLKNGRDAKGRGVIVPEYDVPDKLSPVEVSSIADFNVQNRDITALIIGLAIRKYLRIHETSTPKLIGKDTLEYELELLTDNFTAMSSDEQLIVHALFTKPVVGQRRHMKAASSSLNAVSTDIIQQIPDRLTEAGYFRANPVKSGGRLFSGIAILAVLVYIFEKFFFSSTIIFGAIAAAIIGIIFIKIMPARTIKGVEALEHIKGLKLYLQTAEADRIKMMQSPNAPYASNHGEPARTVELFEKLLPYAMVLGVEKDWAGQFANLYDQPPDWYGGNFSSFSTGYLIGSLGNGFQGAVATSFAAPASSSNSGFGGGGFSGGGGGGGGGGGW